MSTGPIKEHQYYQQIIEASPSGMIVVNREGSILLANKMTETMFGYSRSELLSMKVDELVPKRLQDKHPEHRKDFHQDPKTRLMGAGRDLFGLRKDGTEVPIEIGLNPIETEGEKLVIASIVDITERKKFVKDLFYQKYALDEHSIVVITDVSGKINYVNDKFCQISKYSREELLGQDHRIINSGHHSKEFMRELWRTIASGGTWKGEIKNKAKDGSIYWVDTTIVPFLNESGKPFQYIAIRTDITEQKRDQEELIKQALLIKLTHDAIIVRDKDDKIAFWNYGAEEIYGWGFEEAMGQVTHELFKTNYLNSNVLTVIKEHLNIKNSWDGELRHVRKDGQIIVVDSRWIATKDEHGNKLNVLEINRDITKRKHIEDENLQRSEELGRSNKELEDFAYVVSHDLKAPLRGIASLSEWLVTDYADKLDEDGKKKLLLLHTRVQRMNNLINGILEYSRIARVHSEAQEVDLNEIVNYAIDMVNPPQNIKITIVKKLPTVMCGKVRIEQLFQNLISNAVKYMDKPEGKITIDYTHDEKYHQFSISDNGPGIDEKYYEQIFKLFQTLQSKDKSDSTGVGLALVKRIVEMNKGCVWVESKVGEGATFYFTLLKT